MKVKGWLSAAALALYAALSPGRANAAPPAHHDRPWDAPLGDTPRAAAPELTPEYNSLEEQGVRLVYHLTARERATALMQRALVIRDELSAMLGQPVLRAVEIRVAAMPAYMQALAPPELPLGAPAAAFRDLHLVVMSRGSGVPFDIGELEVQLRHALAHLALDEAVSGHDVPRWFHEGFAIHAAGEEASARAEALCVAALRDRLLDLRDVAARFPDGPASGSLAAAESAELARILIDARPRFTALVREVRNGSSFDGALAAAYDGDLDQVERRFRKEVARRYSFIPVLGAATAIWVVVALGVLFRRRRLAAQRAQAADERRALDAAARLAAREPPAPRVPQEEDDLAQAMPPDPEVPKVEHDGRWYTLH
jgi:hypothetical protein